MKKNQREYELMDGVIDAMCQGYAFDFNKKYPARYRRTGLKLMKELESRGLAKLTGWVLTDEGEYYLESLSKKIYGEE